jgi:transposase
MSTSLLYHRLGARGFVYRRTDYPAGKTLVHIEHDPDRLCCTSCGSANVVRAGTVQRRFRALPIGSTPTWLVLDVQRLRCKDCGRTRQAATGFANPKCHYTRSFERYVLELCRHMTIQAVAAHLQISWDTVKDILKRRLRTRFRKIKLRKLKRLAIDEICIGRGHRYLTVVLDLDSGAVVFIGEGKGADALTPFWKSLKASRAKIEAVATDMSAAYTLAVATHLPKAVHVFDRFHVVKLFNDKLSDLRRQVQNAAETAEQKKVIKGTRWLLLKNPEHLDPERDERQRLDDALRLNAPLATAYYLKEDLRQLWEQSTKARAEVFFDDWLARMRASGIRTLQKLANTMQLHRKGLLAWYDYRISTGPLEGTNNKIKTMQRQAYGYRDQEFFRLKIFALHESKYALVG